MKGKEKNKRKNRGKRIAVFLLSLLTVFSFSPLSQARALPYTNNLRTFTMEDGQQYTGVGISGHQFTNNMNNYLRQALTTGFKDSYSGRWTDLASAWTNLARGFAITGADQEGLSENGACSYRWEDFKEGDMPKELYQIICSGGASCRVSGDWWNKDSTWYNYLGSSTAGYKFEKFYKKKKTTFMNGTDWGTWIDYYSSGLKEASTLNAASQAIEDVIRAGSSKDQYKKCTPAHYEWGEDGKKMQEVFYTDTGFAATSADGTRFLRQSRYAHTGVFFYNFKFTPYYSDATDTKILDKEGKYIPEEYMQTMIQNNWSPNNYPMEDDKELSTTNSTTMTINHADTSTTTNGWGIKIGGSFKKVWKDVAEIAGSVEGSYSHTSATAVSDGWSKSNTISRSKKDTYKVGPFIVNPGCKGVVEGSSGHKTYTASFKAPVMLSFDVAIVNWVIDASKNKSEDKCALVAQFGTAHNHENATEEIRIKADNNWWLDQFDNKVYKKTDFREAKYWAKQCANNIIFCDQEVKYERRVPAMNITGKEYDLYSGQEIKGRTPVPVYDKDGKPVLGEK